jgi:hypothetical protein
MRRLWLSLALVAAVGALVASVTFAVGQASRTRTVGPGMMAGQGWYGTGTGMMGGTGMEAMMGTVWLAGDGTRITSIAAARDRATTAGASIGLHPGEVIWFDNGFYVELKDPAGDSATEVIVDPVTGGVSTEPGPAMMWNTRYGMHRTGTTAPAAVTPDRAQQYATDWLARNLPSRLAQPLDAYPGYYTLETTTSGGTINGMLSVNGTTGQVWYHSWHGRYIAGEDA